MKKIITTFLFLTIWSAASFAADEITCSVETVSRRIRDISVSIKSQKFELQKNSLGRDYAMLFKKNGLSSWVEVLDGKVAIFLNDAYTERITSVVGSKLYIVK